MTDVGIILEALGVTKKFGNLVAVNHVDLRVRRGTVHGIIGPNGAGKTTLFNIFSGELQPTAGETLFEGRPVTRLEPFQRVRLGMGRSFQITSIFQNLSVFENVRVATQVGDGRTAYDFLTLVDHHSPPVVAAETILDRVGLRALATVRAGELSHGWQRVLEVALALAGSPRLLLLDEPTAGMGIEDLERMHNLLLDLARDYTIVLIEHNVRLVMDVCHTVTVLDQGQVLMEGPPEKVSQDARVREAYLGVGI